MSSKVKKWFLVFVWAGLIFFLSHQPDLKSSLSANWDFLLRKIAHILEYAVLTLLLISALKEHQLTNRQILILAISLAILYAISDEYHQSFVLAREGALKDVLIDSFGVLLAGLNKRKMIE